MEEAEAVAFGPTQIKIKKDKLTNGMRKERESVCVREYMLERERE